MTVVRPSVYIILLFVSRVNSVACPLLSLTLNSRFPVAYLETCLVPYKERGIALKLLDSLNHNLVFYR